MEKTTGEVFPSFGLYPGQLQCNRRSQLALKNSLDMTWVGGFPKSEDEKKKVRSSHPFDHIFSGEVFSHPVLNTSSASISTISFAREIPRPQGLSLK